MPGIDPICAVVASPHAKDMMAQLRRALFFTSLVELRLDWLANDAEISSFLRLLSAQKNSHANLLATCRRRQGGGYYKGSIPRQLAHLADAIRSGCHWYDLEVETASQCPPELVEVMLGEGRQLRSAHFFDRMPRDLNRVAADLWSGHPHAIKIAAKCDSLAEGLELLSLVRSHRKKQSQRKRVVAIPMGDVVAPLRILSPARGSMFTYAPVEHPTAPGQVSLEEAKRLYRVDKIGPRTRVYGVIGDPIGHSLSPVMQNAAFQARKKEAVYLPFLVRDLKDFVRAVPALGIRGFSITIPHKEKILRYLDGCDPLVKKIGAVNTVVVRGNGKLYGYNTDYIGVLTTLEKRIPLRGSRVLILGAGGAARAVAFALAEAGSSVCVYARRMEQAKPLAHAVGGVTIERKHLRSERFDAIVNATPVGMHPNVRQSPLEAAELNCRLVFDTIYRPRETRLLQLAARRGIQTVSGVDMFVAQGAAQWEIWTGEPAPREIMRRAVIRTLNGSETNVSKARKKGKRKTIR